MSLTREQLEAMSQTELSALIDDAREVLDIQQGCCTDCHGSGCTPGDAEYACESCGGTGTRSSQLGQYQAEQAGYRVTSITLPTGSIVWAAYRPDNKVIGESFWLTEDAAWAAVKVDFDEWEAERDDPDWDSDDVCPGCGVPIGEDHEDDCEEAEEHD